MSVVFFVQNISQSSYLPDKDAIMIRAMSGWASINAPRRQSMRHDGHMPRASENCSLVIRQALQGSLHFTLITAHPMPLSNQPQIGFATIPKEIMSMIVREDLASCHPFCRGYPMPAGIWNTFFSVPQYDVEELEPCLSHASPRRRIFSHQSERCALQSHGPEAILFSLSQVCQSIRLWLLRDYELWVGAMLLRPTWAPLIASRIPEDTLLDFVRHDGLCQHVVFLIYPYLARSRTIDLVLPSQHPIHATLSMADYIADAIMDASQLTYLDLRFDAGGPAEQTAYKVIVLPNLGQVVLLNSSVLVVGPRVRKLCLVTESNRGTQLYLDILLSGLAQCGRLEELKIDSLLYDNHRGQAWEWPPELRPSPLELPYLKHLSCAGSYMDGVALLYGLHVPDDLELHLDIGLFLAEWDSLAFENLSLGWPMLAFAAPSRARSLIDHAWAVYSNGVIINTTHMDIHDDVPDLVDDDGAVIVPDGNAVTYPRQPGDNHWFDYDVCAFASKAFLPGVHFGDSSNGRDVCYNVLGLVIGQKNPPEKMFYYGPTPLRTPDYVTLYSATSMQDLRLCLSHDRPSARHTCGRARSLTIRHIPDDRDMDHHDGLEIPIDILFRSYTGRCRGDIVTHLILASRPSVTALRISWRWLSHLPELRELTVDGSVFAKDIVALAKWLARRHIRCTKLGKVHIKNVTHLQDVKIHQHSQFLEYVRQITQCRSQLQWKDLEVPSEELD